MNRFAIPLALAALTAFATPHAGVAAWSAYTDTRLDACEDLIKDPSQIEQDMGVASYKCAGYKGYAFWFDEEDVRQSTYFGYLNDDILRAAGETFSAFNHVGDKIEWRLDDKGVPRATILRYFMEHQNPATNSPDKAFYGQILVVSRVGQPDDMTGCVTAYVDALENKYANAIARKLADKQAPTFACGKDKPVFHGKVGSRISEPVYNYPELSQAK